MWKQNMFSCDLHKNQNHMSWIFIIIQYLLSSSVHLYKFPNGKHSQENSLHAPGKAWRHSYCPVLPASTISLVNSIWSMVWCWVQACSEWIHFRDNQFETETVFLKWVSKQSGVGQSSDSRIQPPCFYHRNFNVVSCQLL